MHAVLGDQRFHEGEGFGFGAVEHEEQEACNEVHTLTVVEVLVDYGIRFQYIIEILLGDGLH